jgi:hypothetical protein
LFHSYTEDAPAPNALHAFRARVGDGKIFVTADVSQTLKENKARSPKVTISGENFTGNGVIIVGGGSGAFYAVEALREVRRILDIDVSTDSGLYAARVHWNYYDAQQRAPFTY